ncbi:MAG: hypothetical protein N2446_01805 [Elusimicrobiales bacterium]|nr:hypothetical protein [Elusimicrobiales bacterium]
MFDIKDVIIREFEFKKIKEILYFISGIYLNDSKKDLVKTRLSKRILELGFSNFIDYIKFIEKDTKELYNMIDILTTNKTDFFREIKHFEFMKNNIFPNYKNKNLTIWSAGCSDGKEPYSIAIEIKEFFGNESNKRILATDISSRMIERAKNAIYNFEDIKLIPKEKIEKYFEIVDSKKKLFKIKDDIKKLVSFAVLNLLDKWVMNGPFDIIFCRNVMIYFTQQIQETLVNRFYNILRSGGYLFVGHSESLNSIKHCFKYIQPAIYLKV